ncbi:MAG: tRNA uridine-5-carboxymethylaminomethyl(34) synthesis enzyme MnmG [Elusimicrobiota bacterium]|jgi:tRNA uridine 5-carboxymethylaminomethyl modification enzyme|nr:tRNA uridine-5-carboxymethylaminomethyl(34) synthesis enzyme MnmG [Elusimicrobiota bacterium]
MLNLENNFDVIVIGAGHAGVEAALVAARTNKKTILFTMDLDKIVNLACNPAMGGIAKGQIIREIDALGGEIGKNTDKSMISFNMINISKGVAVHSPRAQCDKNLYHVEMKKILEKQENLTIKQDEITNIKIKNDKIEGVYSKTKIFYRAKAVIITTGTFLNGRVYIGDISFSAGRIGEFASNDLAECIKKLGFKTKRLKTGTPFRILKKSVNFEKLEKYCGDEKINSFSFQTNSSTLKNKDCCYITYTNTKTHKVIRNNLHKSPLYSGKITGIGPRYCPSIEDKVVRFPNMKRHQIFLEPLSLNSDELYCNGISSSLPEKVQTEFLHTIDGLENAIISRIGYAIEYDFYEPTQLKLTLETKLIKNLYFAGQINGTTGYEEAAAQGFIAGINASLKLDKKAPFILKRNEAYIGVLIDDLVTKGVLDPYRMFTSRAEYRLLLRNDNVDERLLKYGYKFGLIPKNLYDEYLRYRKTVNAIKIELENIKEKGISEAHKIRKDFKYYDWIKKIDQNKFNIFKKNKKTYWDKDLIFNAVNIEIKYLGYINRQIEDVKKMEKLEQKKIPENIDFNKIIGLLTETKKKLIEIKPRTLGQASRISGVNPNDIVLLNIYLKK